MVRNTLQQGATHLLQPTEVAGGRNFVPLDAGLILHGFDVGCLRHLRLYFQSVPTWQYYVR
jgi:hypothetical protein